VIVLALVALLAVVVLPQAWVRWTISRHGADRPDLPGTGSELARHLLNRFDLAGVTVERTELGDHYDPDARVVRLGAAHHDGRSVAAAAVAAHEVGHALQHAGGERLLATRQRLAKFAMTTDRFAAVFFIAAPFLGLIARTPIAFAALVGIGMAFMAVRVLVDLVTLPILEEGGYLAAADLPAARRVLRAAALTYLAGALISLVNLARWIRILR
jgi:uncharacterized protein